MRAAQPSAACSNQRNLIAKPYALDLINKKGRNVFKRTISQTDLPNRIAQSYVKAFT